MFLDVKKEINSDFFYIKTIYKFIINLIKFYLMFFKIFFLRIFFFNKKKIKSDIIFLSHKFYGNDLDLYFSDIKSLFNSKKKTFTFFIDQSNFYNNKENRSDLLKSYYFKFSEYISIFFLIHKFFFTILVFFLKSKRIEKRILFYVLSSTISIASLRIYLIVFNFKNIIKLNYVKKIIHTYEGHVYEKYLNLILKKYLSTSTELIGYQHTGLSGSENSIHLNYNKKFSPDKVFCISESDKKILEKKTKINSIVSIGRHRKFNYKKDWKIKKKNFKRKKILILIENNIELIQKFLINHRSYLKQINFTLRPHPEKINITKKIFKSYNVTISEEQDFRKDLNKNDILIFENSTIHFEAIKCGLMILKISKNKNIINIPKKIITNINITSIDDVIKKVDKIRLLDFNKFLNYSIKHYPILNEKKICRYLG